MILLDKLLDGALIKDPKIPDEAISVDWPGTSKLIQIYMMEIKENHK